MLIQSLWKSGVAWDESVPQEIHSAWSYFQNQLPIIEKLRFHRCITKCNTVKTELQGFCDASEKAYGACMYLRSIDAHGQVTMRLVAAKSRVAPIKPLTLPRLELSAALLLARLYKTMQPMTLAEVQDTYLWSDATIVLHWLNTPAHRLKTFVANRVAEIQTITASCHWRHVPTKDNPADLISRGQLPSEFMESTIWHNGPSWLLQDCSVWPNNRLTSIDIPELKPNITKISCFKVEIKGDDLLKKYSSFSKLQAVIAYMMRFMYNTKHKNTRKIGALATTEISAAHNLIISMVQMAAFKKEIETVKSGEDLPDSSKLRSLKPMLDDYGILRVGGRISNALTSFPETQLVDIPTSRLSAWQHAQQLKQHFWGRWHKEYLQHIIKFSKMKGLSNNLKIGVLVLIAENNLPPLKWALGRVKTVHPGKDGVVRVVTLTTKNGECVRCVKKLCPLPVADEEGGIPLLN